MTIGNRIKKEREALGMTLEELAKLCNTTKQTIHKYESGVVTNIPSNRIEQLANALKVTPSYLHGWQENKTTSKDKITEQFLEIFKKLSPENQEKILELCRLYIASQQQK